MKTSSTVFPYSDDRGDGQLERSTRITHTIGQLDRLMDVRVYEFSY